MQRAPRLVDLSVERSLIQRSGSEEYLLDFLEWRILIILLSISTLTHNYHEGPLKQKNNRWRLPHNLSVNVKGSVSSEAQLLHSGLTGTGSTQRFFFTFLLWFNLESSEKLFLFFFFWTVGHLTWNAFTRGIFRYTYAYWTM